MESYSNRVIHGAVCDQEYMLWGEVWSSTQVDTWRKKTSIDDVPDGEDGQKSMIKLRDLSGEQDKRLEYSSIGVLVVLRLQQCRSCLPTYATC
jgi:hypothetical protein